MPRVTTPMIGAAGTGAALRAVGELCQLDPKSVQRTIWAELARTAKLPWYARLEPPETFREPQGRHLRGLHLPPWPRLRPGPRGRAGGRHLRHLPHTPREGLPLPRAHLHRGGFRRGRPRGGRGPHRGRRAGPDRRHSPRRGRGRLPRSTLPPPLSPRRRQAVRRATAHGLRRIQRPGRRPRQRPEVENQGARRRGRHQVDRRGAAGGRQGAAVPAGPGQAARRGPRPQPGTRAR